VNSIELSPADTVNGEPVTVLPPTVKLYDPGVNPPKRYCTLLAQTPLEDAGVKLLIAAWVTPPRASITTAQEFAPYIWAPNQLPSAVLIALVVRFVSVRFPAILWTVNDSNRFAEELHDPVPAQIAIRSVSPAPPVYVDPELHSAPPGQSQLTKMLEGERKLLISPKFGAGSAA
jgi:hypothetical protein